MKLSPRRKEQIVTHATTFPRLFSPFSIRAFVLKNRIVSTSHDAHFGVNGLPTDRYIRYHVEKAKGGAAVVQAFGTTSVHPTSPGGSGNINNWDDSIIPPFRTLAEQVHAHGAIITCQLVHRGRRATSAVTRMPLLAPTDQPNERTGETPRAMSHGDIKMVIDAYAAAAERTCRAGFDGVEIAMFGDMLPDEFLSPTVNTRTDEYGGTLAQRLRFPTELLLAVREAIGPVGANLGGPSLRGARHRRSVLDNRRDRQDPPGTPQARPVVLLPARRLSSAGPRFQSPAARTHPLRRSDRPPRRGGGRAGRRRCGPHRYDPGYHRRSRDATEGCGGPNRRHPAVRWRQRGMYRPAVPGPSHRGRPQSADRPGSRTCGPPPRPNATACRSNRRGSGGIGGRAGCGFTRP